MLCSCPALEHVLDYMCLILQYSKIKMHVVHIHRNKLKCWSENTRCRASTYALYRSTNKQKGVSVLHVQICVATYLAPVTRHFFPAKLPSDIECTNWLIRAEYKKILNSSSAIFLSVAVAALTMLRCGVVIDVVFFGG